jgi:cytochrome c oxidase cbb3-type subunit I/II
MIRPFRSETERYGEYSKAGEFVYDHPFQWGSKRTGPDLHREGGKYPNSWHYLHMNNPRSTSPGSIMPAYTWLYDDNTDWASTEGKIMTLRKLGVPYPEGFEGIALDSAKAQAATIAADIAKSGNVISPDKEIVALIAYMQRLGTDIKKAPVAAH